MYLTISNPASYHAALYICLSKEDTTEETSQSIPNQRSLLEEFAGKHGLSVYDIYVDDGFSGTSFERPAFNRMIQDIDNGNVNMVITKDLSPLGQDYFMAGLYVERYFPEHHVRYISLMDGIDTGIVSADNKITPFRTIMNDMRARDISKKTESVKRSRQQQGLHVGWRPPFGYKALPDHKNELIIDEPAAAIVRRIFTMALSGISCQKIADTLNEEHIPTPSTYAGVAVDCIGPNTGLWQGNCIYGILKNEVYIGNMICGGTEKSNYKTDKYSVNPPGKSRIIKSAHVPIVDEDTFQSVALICSNRKTTRDCKYQSPLRGLIFCHDCGAPLTLVNRPNAAKEDRLFFICNTYHRYSRAHLCTCHCVKEQTVKEVVLSRVQEMCRKYLQPEVLLPVAQKAIERPNLQDSTGLEIQFIERKLSTISSNIDKVYGDRLAGILEPEDFQRIYDKLKAEQNQLTQKLESLQKQNKVPGKQRPAALPLVQKFIEESAYGSEFLASLIERIEFSEDSELYIKFKFHNPHA